MMRECWWVLVIALGVSIAAGCGRQRDADGDDDDDAIGDGDADTDADADADGDADPIVRDFDDDDGGDRGEYPAGPYGLQTGDILQNFSFVVPWGRITFKDLRDDTTDQVLLIYGAAGTCAACLHETPEVMSLWFTRHDQGLEVFGLYISDRNAEPPSAAETAEYFDGKGFPYGGAPWGPNEMFTGYDEYGLPLNMLVDLETMEILERFDGYDTSNGITPIVDRHFPDAD
jgi:hypothetical protein